MTVHDALATAESIGTDRPAPPGPEGRRSSRSKGPFAGSLATSPAAPDERMQALYDRHATHLYRFLLRLTFGDRLAAEDLLQETLLRAWQKIDGLNADVATLRPWLLTVARRIAIDAARARQARPTEVGTLDLAVMPAAGDEAERVLSRQVIRRAMARLSPEHREVVFEIYFQGRSCADTAAILGIPEGTVKSRTFLALRALRTAMNVERAVVPKGPRR